MSEINIQISNSNTKVKLIVQGKEISHLTGPVSVAVRPELMSVQGLTVTTESMLRRPSANLTASSEDIIDDYKKAAEYAEDSYQLLRMVAVTLSKALEARANTTSDCITVTSEYITITFE